MSELYIMSPSLLYCRDIHLVALTTLPVAVSNMNAFLMRTQDIFQHL